MDNAEQSIQNAPLPTPKTLRQRKSLVVQFFRFLSLNRRMVAMITKGSH